MCGAGTRKNKSPIASDDALSCFNDRNLRIANWLDGLQPSSSADIMVSGITYIEDFLEIGRYKKKNARVAH